MFDSDSRYAKVEDAALELTDDEGRPRPVKYKRRRTIPPLESPTPIVDHVVAAGERLDNITARHLGNPTLFWQMCDGQFVLRPKELEEVGRVIHISAPRV